MTTDVPYCFCSNWRWERWGLVVGLVRADLLFAVEPLLTSTSVLVLYVEMI